MFDLEFEDYFLIFVVFLTCWLIYKIATKPDKAEKSKVETTISDSKILESRNYVAKYDTLMENVIKKVDECNAKFSTAAEMNVCKAGVYDVFGITYDHNVEMYNDDKTEYKMHVAIAIKPLTTEK